MKHSICCPFAGLLLFSVVILANPSVSAQVKSETPKYNLDQEYAGWHRMNSINLAEARKKSQELSGGRASDYYAASDEDKKRLEECYNAFSKLYKTVKNTVDIRIAFGYVDHRDGNGLTMVGDLAMKAALIEHLLESCPMDQTPNYFACGFLRDEDNADLLRKKVTGLDGLEKTVQLMITHASSSFDDDKNCQRNPGDINPCVPHSEQSRQSVSARNNFLNGLGNADIVLYAGHSRDGGGPDFNPPHLTSTGAVDEARYRIEGRKNYQLMLSALKEASIEDRPDIIGLLSCSSNRWFKAGIRSIDSQVGFIGSTQTVFLRDEEVALAGALDSIIGMRCKDDFAKSIAVPMDGKSQFILDSFFTTAKIVKTPVRRSSAPAAKPQPRRTKPGTQ